ncbi:hypothetical protein BOTBODRAFT_583444 [Botryobasidium botryosum FD-172 SS1]|uniref:Uncharacterized protein n=1 Tax=Botryobasidium botryosum (strain FD-172 SS1) TaxID=930990 RepID=A0A067N0Y4_BOTB1|nr:hypothetical protein BOTBODRAFT_583444 [Botryobasidium botryosum FD-172 SS1]
MKTTKKLTLALLSILPTFLLMCAPPASGTGVFGEECGSGTCTVTCVPTLALRFFPILSSNPRWLELNVVAASNSSSSLVSSSWFITESPSSTALSISSLLFPPPSSVSILFTHITATAPFILGRLGLWFLLVSLTSIMAAIEGAMPISDFNGAVLVPSVFPEIKSDEDVVVGLHGTAAIVDKGFIEEEVDEENSSVEFARHKAAVEHSLSFSLRVSIFPEVEGDVDVLVMDEVCQEEVGKITVEVARDAEVGGSSMSLPAFVVVSKDEVVVDEGSLEEDVDGEELTVEVARDATVGESKRASVGWRMSSSRPRPPHTTSPRSARRPRP